jgi:hypothetical protein
MSIVDLNNAFVYYLRDLSNANLTNVQNYLNFLKTDDIKFTNTGTPTYNPPIEVQNLNGTLVDFISQGFENNQEGTISSRFNKTESNTATLSVQVTEGLKIGAQSKVEVSIPFIAKAEVNLSAEATLSSTQTSSMSTSQSLGVDTQINVAPRTRVRATLVIKLLQYRGTLTSNVRVSGQLQFNNRRGSISMVQIFRAIKAKPPQTPFSFTDQAGNKFSLTSADVARFTVAPAPRGQVTYRVTANVNANFGLSENVRVDQFDDSSGRMIGQFTLAA